MSKQKESYKDVLEARAQRGEMTHQKEFALNVRQQKEEQENQKKEQENQKKEQENQKKEPKSRTNNKQEVADK